MEEINDKMIDEIMKHLDTETSNGAVRMSITFDDEQEEYSKVSHKCCKVYGKDATEVVGLIDMCQDMYLLDEPKK